MKYLSLKRGLFLLLVSGSLAAISLFITANFKYFPDLTTDYSGSQDVLDKESTSAVEVTIGDTLQDQGARVEQRTNDKQDVPERSTSLNNEDNLEDGGDKAPQEEQSTNEEPEFNHQNDVTDQSIIPEGKHKQNLKTGKSKTSKEEERIEYQDTNHQKDDTDNQPIATSSENVNNQDNSVEEQKREEPKTSQEDVQTNEETDKSSDVQIDPSIASQESKIEEKEKDGDPKISKEDGRSNEEQDNKEDLSVNSEEKIQDEEEEKSQEEGQPDEKHETKDQKDVQDDRSTTSQDKNEEMAEHEKSENPHEEQQPNTEHETTSQEDKKEEPQHAQAMTSKEEEHTNEQPETNEQKDAPDNQATSSNDGEKPQEAERKTSQEGMRGNLLIFAPDRTGSTFATTAINKDPDIFTMYEPLWITNAWKRKGRYGVKIDHAKVVVELIEAFMSCSFHTSVTGVLFCRDLAALNRRIRYASNAFASQDVCAVRTDGLANCSAIDPERADDLCRNKKHTVVKVSTIRTPDGRLALYLPLLHKFKDLKILHLTRDPRGSINSEVKANWTPHLESKGFEGHCMKTCQRMEENIRTGMTLPKDRYKLMSYEEIANYPIGSIQKIYDFAGFGIVPDVVKKWINVTTNPSEKELEKKLLLPLSLVRKAEGNADKWRRTSPRAQVEVIQQSCESLMKLMGYENVVYTDNQGDTSTNQTASAPQS